ncbi:TPA: hypothetical protein ACK8Z3_002734 [Legionella pneumophila]|uniref:DUF1311 domain-containing protein n=1 Tax=Legionella pneumophila subsp. pneumophila TaxID=91891 RepID=A0A3A6WF91_LEGPN|nr:hypothetical protein [Legionella pneumophila]ERH42961.1 hypothetical protein N750_13770 [Legionella pneumophila str. Leg01/53]ERH44344.1 hypothetical protein N751_13915 [Legionella pneumophila str. Leg01/11]ERI47094.1 hypothetical protein N749_15575 [Legionella pneumophila str. Leg01/20]ANN96883.1 hypothetical protein A9P84_14715 [Legionella pneumophila]AUB69993.1 hypothetical protein BJK09_14640 [Legionella pneumophila]
MSKWILLSGSFFLCLFSLSVHSHSFDKEQLVQRCQILHDELKELESHQYNGVCRHKLALAANKIFSAKIRIVYENYKGAKQDLSVSMNNMKFAEDISCVFKSGITKARMEAREIQRELN